MKLLVSGFVFVVGSFWAISMTDANGPPTDHGPDNNANSRARIRSAQIRSSGLSSQGTVRTSSPTPGRGKSMARSTPTRRLARRQDGNRGRGFVTTETTDTGETNNGRRGRGSRAMGFDAPRMAMTRSFNKRLSQIDKIRDKALETGDLGLLELADELELRARRKFDEMTARMDQRQALGKPGVGPPVLVVDPPPVDESPTESDPLDEDTPSDPDSPVDPDLLDDLDDSDLPDADDSSDSDTTEEPDSGATEEPDVAEPETSTQE